MTYVLDASAVLRLLDREAGGERMAEIIEGCDNGDNQVVISAVHWGEIIGIFYKRHGVAHAEKELIRLRSLGLSIMTVTGDRAQRSAYIKAQHTLRRSIRSRTWTPL